jgi:hypothetical protein
MVVIYVEYHQDEKRDLITAITKPSPIINSSS